MQIMKRYYYSDEIERFLSRSEKEILGIIVNNSGYDDQLSQKEAWRAEISILKTVLRKLDGSIYFEYAIPRMGKRIDIVLIIKNVLFVIEFKVGGDEFHQGDIDQVYDYALDLKNFHETSHKVPVAPILVSTESDIISTAISTTHHNDGLLFPILSNSVVLEQVIFNVLYFNEGRNIEAEKWDGGRYSPTPTIIEAAKSLFRTHSVIEIARSDAKAKNLEITSKEILEIIEKARKEKFKAICFVTGVPGAGKTLVGINVATKHLDEKNGDRSVYLSGNDPLVEVLREALARDKINREKEKGVVIRKGEARREVSLFIQKVHQYRDEYIVDKSPPIDHVAIFDEAQRAWTLSKTSDFMRRRKNISNFSYSEPEFLISCLDRHKDWAVIVCLVGGGQEIHTGEAGISEWIVAINNLFSDWKVYISDRLSDREYAAGKAIDLLKNKSHIEFNRNLHLSVSLRSFRAEHLSLMVKNLLDLDITAAKENFQKINKDYPIVITRDISKAKEWLHNQSRGTERYGIIVSSKGERLKPYCIDVKSPMNYVYWFLNGKEDVRSSYYLEAVATEFQIQGLELDWTCVAWDADFRYSEKGWNYFSFQASKWQNVNKKERKQYLKNAYRVLLTRARQGMVIFIPSGDTEDPTRLPDFYDATFDYLKRIGFKVL